MKLCQLLLKATDDLLRMLQLALCTLHLLLHANHALFVLALFLLRRLASTHLLVQALLNVDLQHLHCFDCVTCSS